MFLAVALLLVLVRYLDPTILQAVRLQAFDLMQRYLHAAAEPRGVVVVDIDQASIDQQGRWPWPRAALADLVDQLAQLGFRGIVFDIVLPDAERSAVADDAEPHPGDAALARAMRRVPVVLGLSADSRHIGDPDPGAAEPRSAVLATENSMAAMPAYQGVTRNLAIFEEAAAGIGHLHVANEIDGVARRIPAAIRVGGRLEPGLAFEAMRVFHGANAYVIRRSPVIGDLALNVGETTVPLDREGAVWLGWDTARSVRRISAADVFAGRVGRDGFGDTIAVLGVSAMGVADRWATPLGIMPGVVLQAQATDNLLAGRSVNRPAIARWLEIGFAVLLCSAAALVGGPARGRIAGLLAVGALIVCVSAGAFALFRLLVDPTFPVLACMAVAAARLVDERNQARSDERVASTRLVEAVESLPLGFLLFDERDRLIIANRMAADISGVDRDALRFGMRRRDYVALLGPSQETHAEIDGAESHAYETETRTGGQLLAMEKRMPQGGVALLYTDIGQIKERQRQLEVLREKAEESNRLKSQFLANVSHELRTPLNAIIGFSEILEREMFGPLGHERYRDYAADILDSGRYLLSIVQDLLDLSAFEAGRFGSEPLDTIDVGDLVESVLRLVGEQASRAGITLSSDLPDDPVALRGNHRLLRQILVNLVSNALKFTPAGGEVAIAAARRDDSLVLGVRDNGMGMSPEVVALATRPFWRGNDPFLRNHAGTGLGLALVKSFAAAQGATLEIESTPGKGTSVFVVFPPPGAAELPAGGDPRADDGEGSTDPSPSPAGTAPATSAR